MITGKWNIEITAPIGKLGGTLDLTADGSVLTGTLTDPNGTYDITDASANGEEFTFKCKLKTPMGGMAFTFTGKVDGDAMNGKAKMMMGSMEFTGTRA